MDNKNNNFNGSFNQTNNMNNNYGMPGGSLNNPVNNNYGMPEGSLNNMVNNTYDMGNSNQMNNLNNFENNYNNIDSNYGFDNNAQMNGYNNQMNSQMNNDFSFQDNFNGNSFSSKKKGKKKIFIIIGVIVLFILIVLVLLRFLFFNSDIVFKSFINNSFDFLNEKVSYHERVTGDFSFNIDGVSNDENFSKTLDSLKELEIDSKYQIDYKNKISFVNLKGSYKNNSLFNIISYFEEDSEYLYIGRFFDKVIKVNGSSFSSVFNDNSKEYSSIINSVSNAFDKSISYKYLNTSTKKLDGKLYRANTLVLNDKNISLINNSVIDYLLKDKEFISNVSKVSGLSNDKIIYELTNSKVDLKENNTSIKEFYVTIYTSLVGGKFYSFEVSKDKYNFIVRQTSKNVLNYEVIFNKNIVSGVVKYSFKDSVSNLEFLIKYKDNTISFNVSNKIDYESLVKKKKVTGFVDYDKLSDEDFSKIYSNIYNDKNISGFLNDIG